MLVNQRKLIWQSGKEVWSLLKNREIFLTGGTGFFGKSFLDLILYYNQTCELNLKVTILSRNADKFQKEFSSLVDSKWISFEQGDVKTFKFSKKNYDYILHFATPASVYLNENSPLEMFDIINLGTRQVLEFAKVAKVKAVLLASSGAVYGKQPPDLTHISESYIGAPITSELNSAYGEGKRMAELMGNLYSKACGFDHKIARCFAFVGPYLDPHGTFAIGNFIKNAVKNEPIIVKGDGRDYRSYMYSDDLIYALLKILLFGKNSMPYNVGSDQAISIAELAQTIVKTLNPKLEVKVLGKANLSVLPNRYVPAIELLKKELKITLTTTLEEGIAETAKFYESALNK